MLSFDARSSEEVLILDPSQKEVHEENQPHLRRSNNTEDGQEVPLINNRRVHNLSLKQSISQSADQDIIQLIDREKRSYKSTASREQLSEYRMERVHNAFRIKA